MNGSDFNMKRADVYIEGLDETDNKILNIIKDNARASFSEIGEQIGISRVSVKNRMDRLQEKGIIQGYRTVIDPAKMPEGIKFFLDIQTTQDYYEEMADYLSNSKMIRQVYGVSGNCRIHAIGFASNMKNMERLVNALYRSRRGVLGLDCSTVLTTMKDVDGGIEYERYQEYEHLENSTGEKDRAD